MNLPRVLAVLTGIALLVATIGCTTTPAEVAPTPNIDATVEARVAQERATDATVEARAKELVAAQPTATPYPTYTPVPTATPPPKPTDIPTRVVAPPTTLEATPTVIPTPIPTTYPINTPMPVATPTSIPNPALKPIPTPTLTLVPTATPTLVPTATPVPTATHTPVPTITPTPVPTPTPTPTYKTLISHLNNVISQDTIWNKKGSPYEITQPVGMGANLTIEPGVEITVRPSLTFWDIDENGVFSPIVLGGKRTGGKLVAKGTKSEPIKFINGSAYDLGFSFANVTMELEHVVIIGFERLSRHVPYNIAETTIIRHSRLENLGGGRVNTFLLNPIFEYNTVINTGGMHIRDSDKGGVFRYNCFSNVSEIKPRYSPELNNPEDFVFQYNTILGNTLLNGTEGGPLIATQNYWDGLIDLAQIGQRFIKDRDDSLLYEGTVDYSSPLTQPHPNTPTC